MEQIEKFSRRILVTSVVGSSLVLTAREDLSSLFFVLKKVHTYICRFTPDFFAGVKGHLDFYAG